jgi:pyruvate-formate lyase-activating enzyme
MEINERYITDMDELISVLEENVELIDGIVTYQITESIKDVIMEWKKATREYMLELIETINVEAKE